MSLLTESQQHSAMYYGGTTQKKAKAAMRRTATHLAAVQDSLQLGTLKPDELAALASAAQIMRRLADLTEHAAEEADRIKSRIDHRRAEAMSALNAAPVASTADQVALIALGSYPFELRSLARDCAEFGAHRELPNKLRDARQSIAWDAAKNDRNVRLFIDLKLATLPTVRQTHDALIRQIEQIVETQTAERESRKVAA